MFIPRKRTQLHPALVILGQQSKNVSVTIVEKILPPISSEEPKKIEIVDSPKIKKVEKAIVKVEIEIVEKVEHVNKIENSANVEEKKEQKEVKEKIVEKPKISVKRKKKARVVRKRKRARPTVNNLVEKKDNDNE